MSVFHTYILVCMPFCILNHYFIYANVYFIAHHKILNAKELGTYYFI